MSAHRLAPAVLVSLALSTACLRLGLLDGQPFVHRAKLSDPRIGRSQAFPIVVRIPVAPNATGNTGRLGQLAYRALFSSAGYPSFDFNVSFSSGGADGDGNTGYADPRSIWYNVFFGRYQISVFRDTWGRPFGYRLTSKGPEVVFEDVARVGKADWNYFSNHVYGVPLAAVQACDALDMSALRTAYHGRERVGDRFWDVIEIWNLVVVSAYRAKADPRPLEVTFPDLTSLWRDSFGLTEPGDALPTSFPPMKLHAKLYMAYEAPRGSQKYQTYLFGATVHQDYPDEAENERFLSLQLAALRAIIATHYPDGGFEDPGPRSVIPVQQAPLEPTERKGPPR